MSISFRRDPGKRLTEASNVEFRAYKLYEFLNSLHLSLVTYGKDIILTNPEWVQGFGIKKDIAKYLAL